MSKKGEFGGGYKEKDAAKDTNSTTKEVSRSWHDARDHAAKEGGRWSPGNRGDKSGKK